MSSSDNTTPEYQKYLKSNEWRMKRELVIQRCNNRCEQCGASPVTQIHHRTYERIFNEKLEDLEGLCKACHESEHGVSPEYIDDPNDPRHPLPNIDNDEELELREMAEEEGVDVEDLLYEMREGRDSSPSEGLDPDEMDWEGEDYERD